MVRSRALALAALGLGLTVALAGPVGSQEVQSLLSTGKEQMAARHYEEAMDTLRRVAREAGPGAAAAEARFLSGQAALLAGRPAEAIDEWRSLLEERPESDWAAKARFLIADAHVALGRFDRAVAIVRREADALAGLDRRRQIGSLYLDLGLEFYHGHEEGRAGDPLDPLRVVRDFEQAFPLLRRAREIAGTGPDAPALGSPALPPPTLDHYLATCHVELGRPDRATEEWETLVSDHPEAAILDEALLSLARTLVSRDRRADARARLETLLDRRADSPLVPEARHLLGASRRPVETDDPASRRAGIAAWRELLDRHPDHELVPEVRFDLGRALLAGGDLEEAGSTFRELVEALPDHERAPRALFLVGTCRHRDRDFEGAREVWAELMARYPDHELWSRAKDARIDALLEAGTHHLEGDRPDEARAAWARLIEEHPADPRAARAQMAIADSLAEADRLDGAIDAWRVVVGRYADRSEAPEAQARIAGVLEDRLREMERAIGAWEELIRRFPDSSQARRARRHLAELRETRLVCRTEGLQSPEGDPSIHLSLRNVPEVELRAYRLDLSTYFERKGSVEGVADLAVGIVEPDETWTFEVPDYEAYRTFEVDAPVPVDEPGAWVVSCLEDEYRAETLLVVSDLDLVTRAAPGRILAWTRDRRTGEDLPGAEVVVLDGSGEVVHRGETGDDGVLLADAEDVDASDDVRVLARHEGHVATAGFELPGTGPGFGYVRKGYVYTDRPVYRPGQTVHWRGIVRQVEEGRYVAPDGADCEVIVRDARGSIVAEEAGSLDEFGAMAGSLDLGAEPAVGEYRVTFRVDETDHEGTFRVEAYRVPDVLVDVDPERATALAGEEVAATIRARFRGGGAVGDAPVTWSVWRSGYAFDASRYRRFAWFFAERETGADPGGDLVHRATGRTDEDGLLEVSFPTEATGGDAAYVVSAEVRGPSRRTASGATRIPVTRQGFWTMVRVDRKVYRPGDRITAQVTTVDALHRPRAVEGELVLYRRAAGEGDGWAEVRTRPLATADDGRAEATLRVGEPGEWRVAFRATDRADRLVEGWAGLHVAGERADRSAEAQIVADREIYRTGDEAEVLVNTPVSPTRALLVLEGETILDYRLIDLDEPSRTLAVPMRETFSPNVFLHLAVPGEDELHEATDEVLVFRYLDVEASFDADEVRPGGEVDVTLTARDPSGRPVDAALSLAVVDDAIYRVRPDETPAIRSFFYDERRAHRVAGSSSLAFRYEGTTRERSEAALAELRRRELEAARSALEQESRRMERDAGMLEEAEAEPAPGAIADFAGEEADGGAGGGGLAFAGADGEARPDFPGPEIALPLGRDARDGFRNGLGALGGWGGPVLPAPAQARVREEFRDTATWRPSVRTGEDGEATLTVELPDNLTTWRATVRGATRGALVGEAEARVRATQPLVAEPSLPRFLTQRDESRVGAVVRDRTGEDRRLTVELETTDELAADGGRTAIELPGGGARRVEWPVTARGTGPAEVTVTARGGDVADAAVRDLPVIPHGVREVRARSGDLGSPLPFAFDLPADRVEGTGRLEVRIVPSVATEVVDALRYLRVYPYGCVEQTLNRFYPAVVALEALDDLGVPDLRTRDEVTADARRGLARLAAIQNGDGGWGWWPGRPSHPRITALVVAGMERCREAGVAPDAAVLRRARRACRNMLRDGDSSAADRASLLLALARGRQVGAASYIRAVRDRADLDVPGLARLAIALDEAGRAHAAGPVLEAIRGAAVVEGDLVHWEAQARHGWDASAGEATALAARALLRHAPDDRLVEGAVRWLRERREGMAWRSTKETATVVQALVAWLRHRGVRAVDAEIAVRLNGETYAETTVAEARADRARRVLVIPDADLRDGSNEVRIEARGAGGEDLHVSGVATWVRDVEDIPAAGRALEVERKFVRWLPEASDDPSVAPGWTIVRPEDRPDWRAQDALGEVRAGDRLTAKVSVRVAETLEFVVLEVPIPAGCTVERESGRGPLDRFEPRDDRVAIFCSRLEEGTHVFSYDLRAVVPGRYHVLPAEAGPMYEPEIRGRSAEDRLRVADAGDEIRAVAPTPDEVHARVRRLADEERWRDARPLIDELLEADARLRQPVREELLRLLVRATLATDDAPAAVEAFEALRDENPRDLDLDRETWIGLAEAYAATDEPEAALLLYGRVLMDLARRDLGVAEAYRSLGRELPAQDYVFSVIRRYPDTEAIVTLGYRVARRYYDLERPDREARIRGYRADVPPRMYEEALAALKEFVAHHPESSWNDDAQHYATLAAYRAGRYERAAEEASRLVERYPGSEFEDDGLLHLARARFEAGDHDGALRAGERLLAWRRRTDEGRTRRSEYVPAVQHLFARIHHLRGDLARAAEMYREVADQVADARETLEFLEAEGLEVPAVHRVDAPGGDASAAGVPVRHRNLAEAGISVYRIDLFMLFSQHLDLARLGSVDLTGVAPDLEVEAELAGPAYRWNRTEVALPLEEPGAHLVVTESGGHEASTILLVSDLELRVTTDGGTVRVYATRADGSPAAGAWVKISDGRRIVAEGAADERGIFEARGVSGAASVVADLDGHPAVWREGTDE